jgi:predicted nucleotidyltransferase
MTADTGFPELDALLADFVDEVRAILGDDFVGAYLQGSFALGEADEYSDVDFVIATTGEISDDRLAALQEMHKRVYARDVAWAQHLEGSYIPVARLRHVDPERAPLQYLDNGSDTLVPDPHCNTAVMRWLLREHGITLAGPPIAELVDPVTLADLRREGVVGMREYAQWAREPGPMNRWKQPYLVLTGCRILYTLETGRVVSKHTSATWALSVLDPVWSDLIEAAIADRPDPWLRYYQIADPALAKRTIEFVSYLEGLAAQYAT